MNLCAKQKLTQGHRDQTVAAKREEEGSSGSLGLVDANYYIQNGQTARSHCRAQGTISSLLGLTIKWKRIFLKMCICVKLYHFALQQKLAQDCKQTILQLKKIDCFQRRFRFTTKLSGKVQRFPMYLLHPYMPLLSTFSTRIVYLLQSLTYCVCLVVQSCLTLCNTIDYSPPGSSVHGDSPGKITGVGCHALLRGIFPTQGSNPGLPHCRWILCHLSHQGSPTDTFIITQSPQFTLEFTLGVVHFMDLDKCIMICIYHHGIIQNSFAALKNPLWSVCSSSPAPIPVNH